MTPPRTASTRLLLVSALALAAAGATACASGQGGGGGSASQRDPVTAEELSGIFASDLYRALEQLRPLWIRSRGVRGLPMPTASDLNSGGATAQETVIAVVVDGSYLGGVEVLRTIPVRAVVEIRYMDGPEAAANVAGVVGYGRIVEGAILVQLGGAGNR